MRYEEIIGLLGHYLPSIEKKIKFLEESKNLNQKAKVFSKPILARKNSLQNYPKKPQDFFQKKMVLPPERNNNNNAQSPVKHLGIREILANKTPSSHLEKIKHLEGDLNLIVTNFKISEKK